MKKMLTWLGIILFILAIFRGPFFRATINYTKVSDRGVFQITNTDLLADIAKNRGNKNFSFTELIDLANEMTTKCLTFSSAAAAQNPNVTFQTRKANCVGYAAMFSSIFMQLAQLQNSKKQYTVTHQIGRLDFLGIDLHQFFNAPFFRDHDFNTIIDNSTKEAFNIDSSLSDYFWINRVSSVNRNVSDDKNPSFQGISQAFIWTIILVLLRILVLIIKRILKNESRNVK